MCVCSWGGRYLWYQVPSKIVGMFVGREVSLVPGPFQEGGYVQGVGTHPWTWRTWGWVLTPPHTWTSGGLVPTLLPRPPIWELGYNGIQSASGQYASYWNAFLLKEFSPKHVVLGKSLHVLEAKYF